MFCHKCGKEVADDAYVCVGCGCILGEKPKNTNKGTVKDTISIWSKIASIALIAFYFCFALFIVFFGLGVADLYSKGYVSTTKYSSGYDVLVYTYVRIEYAIGMLISSIFSYISSIVALVSGIKNKEINTRNSCIISFILANAIVILSVGVMLLCW